VALAYECLIYAEMSEYSAFNLDSLAILAFLAILGRAFPWLEVYFGCSLRAISGELKSPDAGRPS
jgi:hypothetical protein